MSWLSEIKDSFLTKSNVLFPDTDEEFNRYSEVYQILNDVYDEGQDETALISRIREYELMNKYITDLDVVYNAYAVEGVTPDPIEKKSIWTYSEDKEISSESSALLDFLDVDENLQILLYMLVSNGNAYGELFFTNEGVSQVRYHDANMVKRVELSDGTLLGFALYNKRFGRTHVTPQSFHANLTDRMKRSKSIANTAEFRMSFWDRYGYFPLAHFEMVHWRLRKKSFYEKYGYGVMDAFSGHWRNALMARNAMVLQRVRSANPPQQITVETGDLINPTVIKKAIVNASRYFKRKSIYKNGQIASTYEADSDLGSRIIPIVADRKLFEISTPDKYSTSPNIEDVAYYDNKIASIGLIPASVINGSEKKGNLASDDVRFAMRLGFIQREVCRGFKKIIENHLIVNGFNRFDIQASKLDVIMPLASKIAMLLESEGIDAKANAFNSLAGIFPKDERYKVIFGISKARTDDFSKRLKKENSTE